MTRDDIYDHLAQVYLGKRKQDTKKKKEFDAWLVINVCIMLIIFASATYGLTAFLTHKTPLLEDKIIYTLHQGKVRMPYNFKSDLEPTKSFILAVPEIDVSKYEAINLSIRAKEEGSPGIIKVVVRNQKNETSAYYIQGVGLDWQEHQIPLDEFKQITDWTSLIDVSFVLETWNVEKQKGVVLIDNVHFTS